MSTEDGPKGIDISKWQATTPSLTGLDFVIARASIGTTPDPMFKTHIANAKKAGLVTGAYHFNWSTIPVSDQIEAFIKAVKSAGGVDLHFIDVEYAGNGIAQFTRAQTRDFIKGVRLGLGDCGLYMSQSGFYTDVDNDYDWVARWGTTPPSITWRFWQYQGSPLDKNRFNGTLAELKALAGKGDAMAALKISSTTPALVSKNTKTNFYDLDGETVIRSADSLGPDRYSMYGAGPILPNGESEYRAVNSNGRVLLVRPDVWKPVPADCPECPPATDCADLEAQVSEQAGIIAGLKTDNAALTLSRDKTYANIDALKG